MIRLGEAELWFAKWAFVFMLPSCCILMFVVGAFQ